MDLDLLFSIANLSVLPAWALLIFLPRWRPGSTVVAPVLIAGLLSALYLVLFATGVLQSSEGSFSSLAELGKLFSNPRALLVGWVHYLAFDLFVGAWEVQDAQRHRIPHLAVVPCLVLTLMAGPVGLLLYLLLRGVLRGQWAMTEQQEVTA